MLTKRTILAPLTLAAALLAFGAQPAAASHDRPSLGFRAFFPLPPLPIPVPVWGHSGHSHRHDYRGGCGGHPSYRGGYGRYDRYDHHDHRDYHHDNRGRYNGHVDPRRGWPHGR